MADGMNDIGYEPLRQVGRFKMYPSGDVVDWEEAKRRCPVNLKPLDDSGIFGHSWDEIQAKQQKRA
jgi:hypothetical protein